MLKSWSWAMLSWHRFAYRQKGSERAPVDIHDLRATFLKQFPAKNKFLQINQIYYNLKIIMQNIIQLIIIND